MSPPATWSAARIRSVARNRSAIIPTKNGEIIAASAVVPAARPICSPEKPSVWPSHVPIVTDQAPHTKYCRNISRDNLIRTLSVTSRFSRSCERVPGERETLLDLLDGAGLATMLVFDVGANRPALFLEQLQDVPDRRVAGSPRGVVALVFLAILEVQVGDARVMLADVGHRVVVGGSEDRK